jgi:ABC-2 type transport system permease protein
MISLVRYGFLGVSDISVWLALGFLTVATAALTYGNYRMFKSGYKLRR